MMGIAGGTGGLPDRDGDNVAGNMWSPKIKLSDAEIHEILYPVLTIYRKEVPDTGGIGKFRGGNALETALMPWDAGSPMTNIGLSHGFEVRVGNGTTGGYPAPNIEMHVVRNSDIKERFKRGQFPRDAEEIAGEEDHPYPKSFWEVNSDDVLVYLCGGGGGYGDPLERDPQLVLKDVREGECTIDYVRDSYGVVITPGSLDLDEDATEKLRREMKEERLREGRH
jgi:N-methylhydantoinase B